MKSFWRWDSDEEFRERVSPHAINEVDYVRQSWTIYALAQSARRLYEELGELRKAVGRLEAILKQMEEETPRMLAQAAEVAVDICHFGERVLLLQKRLALSPHGYGFLNGRARIAAVEAKVRAMMPESPADGNGSGEG